MFVGEVFNGMAGYLSFSPSLILVTSTEGGPRGFPYQGLSPQYTHTKSKTVRWGWSLIQRLVVLLLATEGLSVIRSYDLWKKKKKKKTKSSPQLFQDFECWPSWELNGVLGTYLCTRPLKLYSFQYWISDIGGNLCLTYLSLGWIGELFRIIYGIERPGDDLTRDYTSAAKAAEGGVGAYRLKKKPIADQMHVILWVIKANDVRFETGKYQEIIKFVQHQMREQSESLIFLKFRHMYHT